MIPVTIDQKKKGLDRVISSLKSKPNLNKLLEIFLEEVQEIEDATIEFADQKNLAIAEGEWIDNIGLIVGEDRLGRSDVDYRAAISNRIAINVADGTTDTVISLSKAHTNATSVKIIPYFPAAFVSVVEGSSTVDGSLFKLTQNIKPAGVGALVTNNEDGEGFTPAWRTSPTTLTGTEFSELHFYAVLPAIADPEKAFLAQKVIATTIFT